MKRRKIITGLVLVLAAGVMAAITAPAEVIDNLDFFSDFELLSNLEVLEDEPAGAVVETSTVAVSAQPEVSTETVKASTTTAEGL
jgi:hypothetical protein